MAAAVVSQSDEHSRSSSCSDQFDETFDLITVVELVNPASRAEVKSFLKTVDTTFEAGSETKTTESWLEWAASSKFLKCVETDIPDFILPKNCSGKLIDVKVFSKKSSDDHIYDTHKMIRDRVARGNCFLQITRGPHRESRCILYALKKFTGGLGDDDDKDKGDDTTWKKYFVKPIDDTKKIIATRKANGEAAHLSVIQIDKQLLLCAGSKNVHMLIRRREDIGYYKGYRYNIAAEVCHSIMDLLDSMEPLQKQRLLNFLSVTRFTAVFEILSPLHQHVEDLSYLKKPIVQFITWTKTELEPSPQNLLCTVSPHVGIEIARALGLKTVEYESIAYKNLQDRMKQIRQGYQYEGEVLYFLDDADTVIGLLKKKTVWYIICRALREKLRNSCASYIKQKSTFSIANSIKQVEKRLNEIQSWLGLSEQTLTEWKKLGVAFLQWSVSEVRQGHISMADIADQFPEIWKRHLITNGYSDHIMVECTSESAESNEDGPQRESSPDTS